jgi:hypothetical protein
MSGNVLDVKQLIGRKIEGVRMPYKDLQVRKEFMKKYYQENYLRMYEKSKITGSARASRMTRRAIPKGIVLSLSKNWIKCSDCDKRATRYYHRDYNKPFEVEPVCPSCITKRIPAIPWNHIQPKKEISLYIDKDGKCTPWSRVYQRIQTRCCYDKTHSYYKRGIKNFLNIPQIKTLWFRDKAWLLKKASIDRINGGNYTLENCRFIELEENKKRKRQNI